MKCPYDPYRAGYSPVEGSNVAEEEEPKNSETVEDNAPEPVPSGSIDVVMSWVGSDPDRARRALDAENESAKPRASLIGQLKAILGE